MKKLAILFASMFIMAIAVQNVNAQDVTDNATGAASALILATLEIDAVLPLEFGAIGNVAAGGSVEIDIEGEAALTNVSHPVAGNVGRQGTFLVKGSAGATYVITLPATAVITNTGTNGGTMTIDNFVSDPANIGTLATNGQQTINVGALLTVAAGQNPGLYQGTYQVTVAYN